MKKLPQKTRQIFVHKKQAIITICILLFLAIATIGVILYGKGYTISKEGIVGTGLLVATSTPDGAQVLINGHLTTATDNTINLAPGEYTIKIQKEGYFAWEKKIIIQNEVVSKAEALLFPTAPKLESITSIGIENPQVDPSQTRVAYNVASQAARKNGVYILDMNSRPILTLQSSSTQIADDTVDTFSSSKVIWSPDGQELLASMSATQTMYLLRTSGFNQSPQDITATLDAVISGWKKDKVIKQKALLDPLKKQVQTMIKNNFSIVSWSPDETKILYVASQSATLPLIIKPQLIGTNSTPEQREIKKGSIYVYDIKEDKNYFIHDESLQLPIISTESVTDHQGGSFIRWFSDSRHLIYVHDKRIDVMEYDGLNATTIYAGPFVDSFVYSWPQTPKVLILTNLGNANIEPNLYTITLK